MKIFKNRDPASDRTDLHKLSVEELFHIEGGEDQDMDEDCYAQQCVTGMLLCISNLNDCIIAY